MQRLKMLGRGAARVSLLLQPVSEFLDVFLGYGLRGDVADDAGEALCMQLEAVDSSAGVAARVAPKPG